MFHIIKIPLLYHLDKFIFDVLIIFQGIKAIEQYMKYHQNQRCFSLPVSQEPFELIKSLFPLMSIWFFSPSHIPLSFHQTSTEIWPKGGVTGRLNGRDDESVSEFISYSLFQILSQTVMASPFWLQFLKMSSYFCVLCFCSSLYFPHSLILKPAVVPMYFDYVNQRYIWVSLVRFSDLHRPCN